MRRKIAWALALLLVLVLVVVAALHTSPVESFLLEQARSVLRERGLELEAERLDLDLARASVTLSDLVLRSREAPELPPLLTAKRAHFDLGLVRLLLDGVVTVDEGVVEGLTVDVVVDESGKSNLPPGDDAAQETSEGGVTEFLLSRVRVHGRSARYEDREEGIRVDLPAFELAIDGSAPSLDHDVRLQTESAGSVAWHDTLPLRTLSLRGRLDPERLEVVSSELALGDSRLTASGTIRYGSATELEVDATTELAVGELAGVALPGLAVDGRLSGELTAAGPADALQVEARLRGRGLRYESWPEADVTGEAIWKASEARLAVRDLTVDSPAGRLRADANVGLSEAAGESELRATMEDVDVAQWMGAAGTELRIASRADGTAEARWSGTSVSRASGALQLELDSTRSRPAPGVLPVAGALELSAREGRVVANVSRLQSLGAVVQGEVRAEPTQGSENLADASLDGALDVRVDSLEDTAESLAAFRGPGEDSVTDGEEIRGSARVSLELGGRLAAPTAEARLTAEGVSWSALEDLSASVTASYDPETLVVRNAEVVSEGARVLTARGTIGLAADAPLDLDAEVTRAPLAPLLAAAGPGELPIDGAISLTASVSGTRSSPRARAELEVDDLQAYAESWGRLSAEGDYGERNDGAWLELLLEKPVEGEAPGTLRASASYEPSTRAYEIDLRSENLSVEGMELPGAGTLSGDLRLLASGAGRVDEPSIDLRLDAAGLAIGERTLGDFELRGRVDRGVGDVAFAAPWFGLSGRSSVGLAAPYPAELTVTADATDLSRIPLATPIEGTLSATAEAALDLEAPERGSASIRADELHVELGGSTVALDSPLRASYGDETVRVEELALTTGTSRLSMQGRLPVTAAAGSGELVVDGDLELADLAALAPGEDLAAEGRASLRATLAGSLERLEPSLELSLADATITSGVTTEPVSEVGLDVALDSERLTVTELRARLGTARLRSEGVLPLSWLGEAWPFAAAGTDEPMRFSIDLRGFEPRLLAAAPESLGGLVSFQAQGESDEPDLAALTASLRFSELVLEPEGDRLEQVGTSEIVARDGVVRVESFHLRGEQSELVARGTAELSGARAVDLTLEGETDLAVVASALEGVQLTGPGELAVAVAGTIDEPVVSGGLEVTDATAVLDEPEIAATGVDLLVGVEDNGIRVERFEGELNGGRFEGGGTARLDGGELGSVDFRLSTSDVFLEAPLELRTMSSAELRVTSRDELIAVEGELDILQGSYTDTLEVEDELFDFLRAGDEVELVEERSPLLSRLRYDVAARTSSPIVMDNNLAEMALSLDLRVGGTYYRPGLTGSVTLEEGGEFYLRENTYVVDRGNVTFLNETRIEPALDVLARTEAGDYEVTLEVTGVPGDLETTLTSDPSLPEPDILAVLVTGRTLEEFRGEEVHVAQQHLLSYLAGRATGRVTRGVERALGLSEVRVEPHLVSAESDPSARLTIGQELTPDLSLVYSMNLANSSDQIYIAEYDVTRRLGMAATQQEDNSYRFDVRHRVELGGGANTGRTPSRSVVEDRNIGRVVLSATERFPEVALRKELSIEQGDDYDFFAARRAGKRLEELYREAGYLEARVKLVVEEEEEASVGVGYEIHEGPRVSFSFSGRSIDGDLREATQQAWSQGFFDRQRAADVSEVVRASLAEDGYLESEVETVVDASTPDAKRVEVSVTSGPRYRDYELDVLGVGEGLEERVDEILETVEAKRVLHTNPDLATRPLLELYRSEGYLEAEIGKPEIDLDPDSRTARAVIQVTPGPRYVVRNVDFQGHRASGEEELRAVVPLASGRPYRLEEQRDGTAALEESYWKRGYNDVLVTPRVQSHEEANRVDVVYQIEEGRKEVVDAVVVEGLDRTSEEFVRAQLEFAPGETLVLENTSESRKNLYHTGAFARVELERVPQEVDDDNGEKPVEVRVKLREVKPFSFRYGASYDTDNGPGGIVDLMNRNSLGSARTIGARARYDGFLREVRGYFSQPLLKNFPLKTNIAGYFAREVLNEEGDLELVTKRQGLSVEEELHLRDDSVFAFGYRYERAVNSFQEEGSEIPAGVPFVSAPLTATLTRDTRDEILDATRGSFSSHALEWAPELLGSDFGYLRYFGQYYRYHPLSSPSVIPWVNDAKSRWVYAWAARLGLAQEIGSPFVPSPRRFFAGGGTTVRGFEQDGLGPLQGGDAVFLLNQELRFPLISFFDGVAFLDVGNVYEDLSSVRFDLRETAGLGLRVRTPYFLLRLDYGFKLDRRVGESQGAFFFSIGQAF